MEPGPAPSPATLTAPGPASLTVTDPNGHRIRVALDPLPFHIGRHADNQLILRDSRVSRSHARIEVELGEYVLHDCGSRHGTFVNGARVERHVLRPADRIEFGARDSYQAVFSLDGQDLKRLVEQVAAPERSEGGVNVGGNMGKLRAILDLARTLQSSFSVNDVLAQVVDAALAVTGGERGFLLLRSGEALDMRVARHRNGHNLHDSDLRVPRELINRALRHRRELLSMNFDPLGADETRPANSIADLELRSVVCVPLVRIRAGQGDATSVLSTASETVGVLYMDSRVAAADLAAGNRELLQTLAIEASTVLENARLLEEERAKQVMDEELRVARSIQQSLLPAQLPVEGWLRAAASSMASQQVGGDYYDLVEATPGCWSAVVADVSGKGVSSALLAGVLQGALMITGAVQGELNHGMARLNRFLFERTGGEKYATIFYCRVERDGRVRYVNAAHCPPLVLRSSGVTAVLEATGMPVGLIEGAEFEVADTRLTPGDKLVIYTDGVTEAQDANGAFFGARRLQTLTAAHAVSSAEAVHDAIQTAVRDFTQGAAQSDDITLLVLEYAG
ncbi:MAG: SpoIIE family protein phosphatase [Bryobacteraceae bacterium]